MINLYYSLVYPYLTYCNIVWGGTCAAHLNPLITLQKRVIRILTNQDYLAHTSPLFHRTGILKVNDLHTYLLAIHVFKIKLQGNFPPPPHHSHLTRYRDNLAPTFHRLALSQCAVSFAAPTVWNNLPANVKNCSSIAAFKKKLKALLVASYLDE